MNKHLKIGIGIVVMMLAIGFASVTTNLILNNNVKLGFNSSNFDIYFSSAVPEANGTAVIDSTTRQTITYETKTLKQVGDQAYLDYVVTNASTQYDANCTVEFTIDNGADEYVTIEQTGFVENVTSLVEAQSDKSGRIVITLKKGSMEPLQINFTVKIIVEPKGREEEAEQPGDPTENEVLKFTVDNRPSPHYVPKYDDETGTIARTEYIVDIYTKYDNTDVLFYQSLWDDSSNSEIYTSDYFEFIGKTGNKYTYRVNLAGYPSYFFDCFVDLVDKNDHDTVYSYNNYSFTIADDITMQQANGDNDYKYEQGVRPWATWFINEGRETHCGWIDSNQVCIK